MMTMMILVLIHCIISKGIGGIVEEQPIFHKSMSLLARRYQFIEILKKSTSSIILKVKDTFSREEGDDDGKKIMKMYHLSKRAMGIREANRLMRLNREDMNESVAIVRLECTFSYQGYFCLLLERLSSKSPHLYLEPSRRNTESMQTLRKIGFQLIVALNVIHRCSLIYGNLRPGHIFLTKESKLTTEWMKPVYMLRYRRSRFIDSILDCRSCQVKLIDFSFPFEEGPPESCDEEVGKISYWAPEV